MLHKQVASGPTDGAMTKSPPLINELSYKYKSCENIKNAEDSDRGGGGHCDFCFSSVHGPSQISLIRACRVLGPFFKPKPLVYPPIMTFEQTSTKRRNRCLERVKWSRSIFH